MIRCLKEKFVPSVNFVFYHQEIAASTVGYKLDIIGNGLLDFFNCIGAMRALKGSATFFSSES